MSQKIRIKLWKGVRIVLSVRDVTYMDTMRKLAK